MSSPFDLLPVEIWERIFENVNDLKELMRLQQVCKGWRNVTESMVSDFRTWHYCTNNMPDYFLNDILKKRFPFPVSQSPSVKDFWRDCQKSHIPKDVKRTWGNLAACTDKNSECRVTKFSVSHSSHRLNHLTCTASWGHYLAILNPQSESLTVYDTRKMSKPIITKKTMHERYTNLKFSAITENQLFVVLIGGSHSVSFCAIPDGSLTCYDVPSHKSAFIVNSQCFFWDCDNQTLTPSKLLPDGVEVSTNVKFSTTLYHDEYLIIDVRVNGAQLELFTQDQVIPDTPTIEISKYEIPSKSDDKPQLIHRLGDVTYYEAPALEYNDTYEFIPDAIGDRILFTDDEKILLFSIRNKSWDVYDLMSENFDRPGISKIVVYCDLLIVGLMSGWIHIYQLYDISSESRHFDYNNESPLKQIHLGDHPVIGIEFMHNSDTRPMIAVVTETTGYILDFLSAHD